LKQLVSKFLNAQKAYKNFLAPIYGVLPSSTKTPYWHILVVP